jgi:hypothetical protein
LSTPPPPPNPTPMAYKFAEKTETDFSIDDPVILLIAAKEDAPAFQKVIEKVNVNPNPLD